MDLAVFIWSLSSADERLFFFTLQKFPVYSVWFSSYTLVNTFLEDILQKMNECINLK